LGSSHVVRGGCWYVKVAFGRSARRDFDVWNLPNSFGFPDGIIGFRVALAPSP
jgi:formylglycine-generating enzyme required for sulfatase activity